MKIRTQNERLTSVMKIRVSVKDYVALSFLVYCSPILVWEELRLRSTERFRLGAGRRALVPPYTS